MAHNYSNVASVAAVASPINSSATSLSVSSFTGYPSSPFWILVDRDTASSEVMEVTAVLGTTLTVVRAQGGTAAASHSAGATVEHIIPAEVAEDSEAHYSATSNVHGVTGTIVGASAAQTLTNKTYAGAHTHTYTDATPADPAAGYLVTADSTAARDGFLAANTGADSARRGFLLTQSGTPRVEAFYDGTLKVTPSGAATRPGIESTTSVKSATAQVTGNATVGGTLGVSGATTLAAVTAAGALSATAAGTGLAVTNNATVGGTLAVTGAASAASVTASGAVAGASVAATAAVTGATVTSTGLITAGNALTVTTGNLTLSGTNAKLQFPSTASGNGTATGQVRYRGAQLEVWNGTRWVGAGASGSANSNFDFGSGSITSQTTLASLTVSDPGFAYTMHAQGGAEITCPAGRRVDLHVRLDDDDGDTYAYGSGILGNTFVVQSGVATAAGLTGTHTFFLVAIPAPSAGTPSLTGNGQSFTVWWSPS